MPENEKLKSLALTIFLKLVQNRPDDWWDWQLVANKAFDIAASFETIADSRLNPPSSPSLAPIEAPVESSVEAPVEALTSVSAQPGVINLGR